MKILLIIKKCWKCNGCGEYITYGIIRGDRKLIMDKCTSCSGTGLTETYIDCLECVEI